MRSTKIPAGKRPNILIIYVDDLALGDVGAFGCPENGTEKKDLLARDGMKLTNAYTINAPCSPSRTGLMMGMYPPRVEGNEYFGGGAPYISIDGSYLTEVEGQYVLNFIEKHANKDKPSFMYFVPLAVHIPNTEVPVKYLSHLYPNHIGKYSKRQYLRAVVKVEKTDLTCSGKVTSECLRS